MSALSIVTALSLGLPGADPTPAPTPLQDINLDTTGGGGSHSFEFFLVSFILALACVAIGLLLARQLRRMNRNYREKVAAGELPDEDVTAPFEGSVRRPGGVGRTDAGPDDNELPPGGGPDVKN